MSSEFDDDLSFEALDVLLDRALALDAKERDAYLDTLGPLQRDAVADLLANSDANSLTRIGDTAKAAMRQIEIAADGEGTSIGDWLLTREIGSGGTGQVFYAERREDRDGADAFVQRAAVKVLWSHRVASEFRERFLRERRILASIDHPGLARFLDGGLLGDRRPWFAMEYVDGDHVVDYSTSLPTDERLALFLAVADTIDYAHQRLIVHRDIKPQNILVDAHGKPRVLDFGIAGMLGEFEGEELTRAQGTPLTLQYASPEQVTGGSIAVASDVYQLGLLLYEMLTSEKPYSVEGESLQDGIDIICQRHPSAPSTHNNAVDKDLDAIVGKALRKNPADRYSSAAAMADDVRRCIAGQPITARPQSNWYVLRCFLRRNALASSIAAASFVALAFATLFSINQAREAQAEASRSLATQEILADVFEQADPFGEGGEKVTLADALVRAQPIIEARVAHDPRLAWEVNRTLSGIFTNLDLLDLERQAFQDALDAALALDGDNEAERLFAIAGLGNILVRTDPAQGVEFFAEHLPDSPSSERGAMDWLSAKYAETSAFIRLNDNTSADQGARDMDRVARAFRVDAPRTLGRIDQLLAGAARRAGDIALADNHWASAVENMRRADAPLGLAVTLSNYALHYGMTERYDTSAAAFEESVEIFRHHAADNTSHAGVLRLYAGLLFRMRRPEDGQAALDESLAILDPQEQGYAYFLAQLMRANFAFANDDVAVAFDAIARGLDVAVPAFGRDSDVTERLLPVFARLLVFAGRTHEAAGLVGLTEPQLCNDEKLLVSEIETVSSQIAGAPDTEAARQALWLGMNVLMQSAANGQVKAEHFSAALAEYRNDTDVFLDSLDRYQYIAALNALAAGNHAGIRAERDRLEALKTHAQGLLSGGDEGVRLQRLLTATRRGPDSLCKNN